MQGMVIYVNVSLSSDGTEGFVRAKGKRDSENHFIAEYMLNERSINVSMNSSKKFVRCVLIWSFLCCPPISVVAK